MVISVRMRNERMQIGILRITRPEIFSHDVSYPARRPEECCIVDGRVWRRLKRSRIAPGNPITTRKIWIQSI